MSGLVLARNSIVSSTTVFCCTVSCSSLPSVCTWVFSTSVLLGSVSSFFFFVIFFILSIYLRYTAASAALPISRARCSIATAACTLWACFLPEFSIFFTLASASFTVANFRPGIVPLGFSSVYRSLCLSLPAGCPFLRGILGVSFTIDGGISNPSAAADSWANIDCIWSSFLTFSTNFFFSSDAASLSSSIIFCISDAIYSLIISQNQPKVKFLVELFYCYLVVLPTKFKIIHFKFFLYYIYNVSILFI